MSRLHYAKLALGQRLGANLKKKSVVAALAAAVFAAVAAAAVVVPSAKWSAAEDHRGTSGEVSCALLCIQIDVPGVCILSAPRRQHPL